MSEYRYFMENDEEFRRLEMKTDPGQVTRQAAWAGLRPGMRVADLGCGPGITTLRLHEMAQPGGGATGVDIAPQRIDYANKAYGPQGPEFVCRDIFDGLEDLGTFDFVWVRFVLEYHRSRAFEMVRRIRRILKPGGILCLLDLDYNCLNHHGLPDRLQRTIERVVRTLEANADFDPRVGIKLYSFLYDLGFENIDAMMAPHHLIFGELGTVDEFNWTKKVEVAVKKYASLMSDYPGGFAGFYKEFKNGFGDPRRFTYTPLIGVRGVLPAPD